MVSSTSFALFRFVYSRSTVAVCLLLFAGAAVYPAAAAFVDETAMRLPTGLTPAYRFVSGDIDNDGHVDLLQVGPGGGRLLINDGSGSFTDAAVAPLLQDGERTVNAAMVDVDDDGSLDLVLIAYRGRNRLLLNDGFGEFTDVTATHLPDAVHQYLDLAVGDVDGDGRPDLVFATRDAGVRLWLNTGGAFVDATSSRIPADSRPALAVALIDTDNDGALHLFAGADTGEHIFLHNNGVGSFTTISAAALPAGLPKIWHARAVDIDGDGRADLVLAAGAAGVRLLRNNGSGAFVDETADRVPVLTDWVIDVAAGDVNVNGHLDLMLACPGQDRLLTNNGDGIFTHVGTPWLPIDTERTFGAAFVDIDSDLAPDLVLAHPNGQNRLWRNAMPEPRVRVTASPSVVEVGAAVRIVVQATDDDAIAALDATVNGIPIALSDGQADYVPASAVAYLVEATARNAAGLTTTRNAAFSAVANLPPVVNAGPNVGIFRGEPFLSSGSFTDPGSGPWSATVDYGDGSGEQPLTLNPDKTFALSHIYDAFGTFIVMVRIDDGVSIGVGTALAAVLNQPPVLTAIPDQTVQDPAPFAPIPLDDYVADPDHSAGEITWTVDGNVAFQVDIDADRIARITYAPGTRASENLTFTASDPLGDSAGATARFSVVEPSTDVLPPTALLDVNPTTLALGTAAQIDIHVEDNVAVTDVSLKADGTPLILVDVDDGHYQGFYTGSVPGVQDLHLRVADAAGNSFVTSAEVLVVDAALPSALVVAIESPEADAVVKVPTDIVGTASGPNLAYYELSVAEIGSDSFVSFARGSTSVVEDTLAVLDPTVLSNGVYALRLAAYDLSGHSATIDTLLRVSGRAKIGIFRISFDDKQIPTGRLPITVVRSYDSTDKRPGDFGVGWRLEYNRARVVENRVPGIDWEQIVTGGGMAATYRLQGLGEHTATVTLGGDNDISFALRPSPDVQPFYPINTLTGMTYTSTAAGAGTLTPNRQAAWTSATLGPLEILDDLLRTYDPTAYTYRSPDGYEYRFAQDSDNALMHHLTEVQEPNGAALLITPGGIIHSDGHSVVFDRDAAGRIVSLRDPNGNEIHYEYSLRGDLAAVIDENGNRTGFVYDDEHNLLEIHDTTGQPVAHNVYDAQGRVIAVIDAAGNRREFEHDLVHRREVIRDRLGNRVELLYDEDGNTISKTYPDGSVSTYTYDADSNVLSITDALGHTRTCTYDGNGNRLSATDPLGNRTAWTYNAQGRMLTETDARGNSRVYTYDTKGNLLTDTDREGHTTTHRYDDDGRVVETIEPSGAQTLYEYDTLGNLSAKTDALGNLVTYIYDANGNRLTEHVEWSGPDGLITLVTAYTHDAQGRVTSHTDSAGLVLGTEYNSRGRVAAEQDALGRRTEYEYDVFGRLARKRFPNGTEETYQYDAEDRRTHVTDRAGRTTEYRYNTLNRLTEVIYPDGATASFQYDIAGRLVATADGNGNLTQWTLDAAGRRIKRTDALGQQTTMELDANGNLIAETDPNGQTTTWTFDGNNRPVRTTFADGTWTATSYDHAGRPLSMTDENGNVTTYEYDALGHLIRVSDAEGGVTQHTYDELGNLTSTRDANGHVTRFRHDARGQLTRVIRPLGMSRDLTYDAAGNLLQESNFRGQITTHSYDIMDRRILTMHPDGSEESFIYDNSDRIVSVQDALGETTRTYDSRGRQVSENRPDGTVLGYGYDAAGNRTALTTPAGTVHYDYDAMSRLTRVTAPDGAATQFAYDSVGRRSDVVYPEGVLQVNFAHDERGRVVLIDVRNDSSDLLARYEYSLDAAGRRIAVEESPAERRVTYTYDDRNQLLAEAIEDPTHGNRIIGYTYDAVGNRLSKQDSGAADVTYTYDANDRLLNIDSTAFTYDDDGNLTGVTGPGRTASFSYNSRNRMTAADDGTRQVQYQYDHQGNRVAAIVDDDQVTNFLIDSNRRLAQVLAETDASGADLASYIYGDAVLSQRQGGITRYPVLDATGSVRLLVDTSGRVTDRYDYAAFGNLLEQSGSTPNRYLFNAQFLDPTSGFYYLRARWLSAESGRFISTDPLPGILAQPQTLHRYAYAYNSPLNYADPSGLSPLLDVTFALGVFSQLSSMTFTYFMPAMITVKVIDGLWKPGYLMQQSAIDLVAAGADGEVLAHAQMLHVHGGKMMVTAGQLIELGKQISDFAGAFTGLAGGLHSAVLAKSAVMQMAQLAKLLQMVADLRSANTDIRGNIDALHVSLVGGKEKAPEVQAQGESFYKNIGTYSKLALDILEQLP